MKTDKINYYKTLITSLGVTSMFAYAFACIFPVMIILPQFILIFFKVDSIKGIVLGFQMLIICLIVFIHYFFLPKFLLGLMIKEDKNRYIKYINVIIFIVVECYFINHLSFFEAHFPNLDFFSFFIPLVFIMIFGEARYQKIDARVKKIEADEI